MLILLLCFYMLVGHWLACIWYHIGRSDAENGYVYGWLWKLGNITKVSPSLHRVSNNNNKHILTAFFLHSIDFVNKKV